MTVGTIVRYLQQGPTVLVALVNRCIGTLCSSACCSTAATFKGTKLHGDSVLSSVLLPGELQTWSGAPLHPQAVIILVSFHFWLLRS